MVKMASMVVLIFCSLVFAACSFNEGNAQVKAFDPQSLYQHFKQVWKSARAADGKVHLAAGPAPGLSYYTPVTEQLLTNGSVPEDAVINYYNSMTDQRKKQLYDAESKLQACWSQTKGQSQSSPKMYDYCYFHPLACTSYKYESLVKGETQLKLIECLGQKVPELIGLLEESFGREKSSSGNHGLHIEFGAGFSFGLYFQGSSGVGFGLSNPSNNLITYTYCWGAKIDASIGGGVSISYFPDMGDILGEAITLEFGLDVPGTEAGVDVLLHYSADSRDIVGFGLSFGIGIGLSPVDLATSYCNTKLIAQYQSSVLIAIGSVSGWTCKLGYVGVVSEDAYICCPEDNPDHSCTDFCWFDGKVCPHSPQELAKTKGESYVILRSSCPGQTYIADAYNNEQKCYDLWKQDERQKYVVWSNTTGECWFSDTYSIDTCAWAPRVGSKIYVRSRLDEVGEPYNSEQTCYDGECRVNDTYSIDTHAYHNEL